MQAVILSFRNKCYRTRYVYRDKIKGKFDEISVRNVGYNEATRKMD